MKVGTDQSARREVPYFPAAVAASGLLWLCGLAVVGFEVLFSRRAHPATLLVPGGLLALTVCVGLIRRRYVVRAVEFTEAEVRLESLVGVRTMPLAEVSAIRVEHTGDTASGYQQTTLWLERSDGSRSLACNHDPALGEALKRLIPPHVAVEERWDELQEPSSG